jgi:hypothetical protein
VGANLANREGIGVTAPTEPQIVMPIDLLGAIAKFAYQGDDIREHLQGVYVSSNELELIATDGHRLVRVDLAAPRFHDTKWERTDPSFLIPLRGIRAVVANDRVAGARYVKIRHADKGPSASSTLVRFDVCGAERTSLYTIECRTYGLTYPPVDQIMPTRRSGEPPEIVFDPRLLADFEPVVTALGAKGFGLKVQAWGDEVSPMLFANDHVRFVVMPMRTPRPELRSV